MSLRSLLARTLLLSVSLGGCSPATEFTATPWQTSTNGEWLTRVARFDTVGPGNNSLYETVELKRSATNKGVAILTLDEGSELPDRLKGPPVITLRWRDPSHLAIAYRAGTVIHQIVKADHVFVETSRSDTLR